MKSLYLHINNGGTTIGVERSTLWLQASHFGNNIHTWRLDMTPEGMRELGQMLLDQAALNERTKNPNPAEVRDRDSEPWTNILTFDDHPTEMVAAANSVPSKMSYHWVQGGIVFYDATDDTVWIADSEAKNSKPMDRASIGVETEWTPFKNAEMAAEIRKGKGS
jgi:hypothetical protein